MLPVSDWFLLWDMAVPLRDDGSASAFGVDIGSTLLGWGVVIGVVLANFSQGLGESRDSTFAEIGVARVDEVTADLGVVMLVEAERGVYGVKGVRILGDSSVLEDRLVTSEGVLPERRRLKESWRASLGRVPLWLGITKGARLLGDNG